VRGEIVASLRQERALDRAREQAEADRAKTARGQSLAEAVEGRSLKETPPFAARDDVVPGLGVVPGFVEAAFTFGAGEVSDLIETVDAVYLLTPGERLAAQVPPLEEIRARVESDARRARSQALARESADKLLARAREIGLEKAGSEIGAKIEKTGPFARRGGAIPTLGNVPDLRTDAFALTAEAPLAPKVYSATGDAVVAALGARIPVDMAGFAAAKDGVLDSLLQQKRAAALTAYMGFLKERALRAGALEVRANALASG